MCPKQLKKGSTTFGEQLFLCISLPTATSLGDKKHWLVIVDIVLISHGELSDKVELMKKLNAKYNIQVKKFDMMMQVILCKKEGSGISFE